MQNKTFWQYWNMVWNEAKNKSYKALGFGLRITGIIVSAIGGGMVSYIRGGNMMDNLISAGVGVVIWIGIWFIYVTLFFVQEPVLIHNEKENTIHGMMGKWGMDRILTDRVIVIPSRDERELRAVLRIENTEDCDLDRCCARATRVLVEKDGIWLNQTSTANQGRELLTWYLHSDAEKITVSRDGVSEWLSVAHYEHDGTIAITHHGKNNKVTKNFKKDAKVYIEVQIGGDMKDKPIRPIVFKGFILQDAQGVYLEEGELPPIEAA